MPTLPNSIQKQRSGNIPYPAYYRLQQTILQDIENGKLTPESRISPERVLAKKHGVSIGTVKKALLNLVHEGYLYRVQGKGTFVAGTTLRRESLRYYRLMTDFDDAEAEMAVCLLSVETMAAGREIGRYLALRSGDIIYNVKRLFSFHKKPMVYCESYLPEKMFPGLESMPVMFYQNKTLYEALEEKYGVPTIYNQKLIGVRSVNEATAKVLMVDEHRPLLFIEMRSFTYKDQPYEYRHSYCVTDDRKIFTEI